MGNGKSKCGVPDCEDFIGPLGGFYCGSHQCMYCNGSNSKEPGDMACLGCTCRIDECYNLVEHNKSYCCAHLCKTCQEQPKRPNGPLCDTCLRSVLAERKRLAAAQSI